MKLCVAAIRQFRQQRKKEKHEIPVAHISPSNFHHRRHHRNYLFIHPADAYEYFGTQCYTSAETDVLLSLYFFFFSIFVSLVPNFQMLVSIPFGSDTAQLARPCLNAL